MRFVNIVGAIGVIAVAGACATVARPGRNNIAQLEKARDANPRSLGALRALGIAYYKNERYKDALDVLKKASALAPNDGVTSLYLGMSAEQTNDLTTARQAYSSYLSFGRTQPVRAQLRARLAMLSRRELELAAKRAVELESTLSQVPSSPRTVAVLPLRYTGTDSTLKPLERGLAELIVTDLSRSRQITVVERSRIQAILDEIALSQGNRVDATSQVRAGKLVAAGRLVQGGITSTPGRAALTIDAAIVDAQTSQAVGSAQASDALDQLFAMEKRLVFDIFQTMGVTLTAAERVLVEQQPTKSLRAFLSYSAGLLSEDNGNLDEAARHYQEAVRIDPSFVQAVTRGADVQNAIVGAATTTNTVEAQLRGSSEGAIANAGFGSGFGGLNSETLTGTLNAVNPSPGADLLSIVSGQQGGQTTTPEQPNTPPTREPVPDLTGGKITPSPGQVVIIIRKP